MLNGTIWGVTFGIGRRGKTSVTTKIVPFCVSVPAVFTNKVETPISYLRQRGTVDAVYLCDISSSTTKVVVASARKLCAKTNLKTVVRIHAKFMHNEYRDWRASKCVWSNKLRRRSGGRRMLYCLASPTL